MSKLRLEYDAYRGGFAVCFEKMNRARKVDLFDGKMQAFLTEAGRVLAIESWGYLL